MASPFGDHRGLSSRTLSVMALQSDSEIGPDARNGATKMRDVPGVVALNEIQRSSGEKRGFQSDHVEWFSNPVMCFDRRSKTAMRAVPAPRHSTRWPSDDQPPLAAQSDTRSCTPLARETNSRTESF